MRSTKIVATIGPASGSLPIIEGLMAAGMDAARLNFSHGTHREHAQYIRVLRQQSQRLCRPLAIIQDLPGPKLRTGKLRGGEVGLEEGAQFTLTTRKALGDERGVSVSLATLPQEVGPGVGIFLDNGAIELEVEATTNTEVRCRVVVGGRLGEGKGINVPGVSLRLPSFTSADRRHLTFGLDQGVDFVALSFVRRGVDIREVREFLRHRGADVAIIAKIEKHEALGNLEEILDEADGVMVARGDLGVEIPLPKVPLAQKEIIRRCNQRGKPVIVATQMLESMVDSPRPTRAEVTDVANAIFDGADALMLSEETAVGSYPVAAVAMMAEVAREADAALPYRRLLEERGAEMCPQVDEAIGYNACHTAEHLGAAAIVAFTMSGSTARRVSRYRPRVPILAPTPSPITRRRLALSWGVSSYEVAQPATVDELFAQGTRLALETGIAKPGNIIVITAGVPIGVPGSTNLLKVQRVP